MKKLLELQEKLKPIIKDAKNPFFNSFYADVNKIIETIKPALNEVGLVILQPLTHIDGKPAIKTIIIDAETGKELSEDIVPIPDLADPQKMGSCITYFRRYALQSLLLLEAEDDDANNASSPNTAGKDSGFARKPERPFMQTYNGGKAVKKGGDPNAEFAPEGELPSIQVNEM